MSGSKQNLDGRGAQLPGLGSVPQQDALYCPLQRGVGGVHSLPRAALWSHLLRGPRPQGSHGGTDYGKENSTTSDFSMKVFLCVCFIYLILTPVYELWETALHLTYINTKRNSACHIFLWCWECSPSACPHFCLLHHCGPVTGR